jgi:hypothetical protein
VANLEREVARSMSFTVRAFAETQQDLEDHQLLVLRSNRGLYSTCSQPIGVNLVVIRFKVCAEVA